MNFNRHDFANKLHKANNKLNESVSLNESYDNIITEGKFAEWEVSFKRMNLGGTKLHPKNVYKVKARNTVEAIKKAAKLAGVKDNYWHATETNFLNKLNEGELNEKKVMDLDVLLDRFQDSDYSPSNSSLKDLENFIDFIRDYLPKGTLVESDLNENRRSSHDKTDGPVVTDIKGALAKGKVNVGSMVEVSVDSNNKNLPDGEYAIMPFTDMGDYWNVRDLKRFAEPIIADLTKSLKGKYKVELVNVDTGKSIRSYIVKVTK